MKIGYWFPEVSCIPEMCVEELLSFANHIQIEFNAVQVQNRSEIDGCFDLETRYDDGKKMLVFGFTRLWNSVFIILISFHRDCLSWEEH